MVITINTAMPHLPHRKLKKEVLALLQAKDLHASLETLCRFRARQIVNPLFGLLYHGEPLIRWRAVTAMGAVVSRLADAQIESARIIMRRFMWNLNDESGGIGWGSPESMGEIMAQSKPLAAEFGCILISYADPAGNYLEHPALQQGVLWAWGRLARQQPEIIRPSSNLLIPYLSSKDVYLQGLAAWAAAPLGDSTLQNHLKALCDNHEKIPIYWNHELKKHTIGQLAEQAAGINR